MQWLIKCCTRSALGLIAAALLLAGLPAHAKAVSGAPDAASREGQPRLLAQSTAQQEEAAQLEKRRLEEQQKKLEMEKQQGQQSQPKKMKTRGPMPEAAPTAPSGRGRFGAGVVRDKETGEVD